MTLEYLLVDGYNVINAWPELRELGNLEHESAIWPGATPCSTGVSGR